MELDLSVLKNKAHEAVVISHASIVIPYTLGMGLAYYIYSEYAPPTVPFLSFGLFMGIAMSITAFPVLARIIQERGLTRTNSGAIAITSAAADDIICSVHFSCSNRYRKSWLIYVGIIYYWFLLRDVVVYGLPHWTFPQTIG